MTLQEGRFDVIPYSDLSDEASWVRIGKGSFGCVYRGEYLGLDVAIKEVLDSDEYDVDKYFQREVKILQESRHPNIVQYLGLCLAPPALPRDSTFNQDTTSSIPPYQSSAQNKSKVRQRILIISEFLTGGNARTYICSHKVPFPWRLRLSFAVDVARAVAYMHARRCMHRDLKGENLLLTDNMRIKVCDFGFARIAARNDEEMRRISYCGTDGYMSPEILQGNEFGLPTDVYSVGIIFCEIMSRQLADQDIFRRDLPFYKLDPDEVKERASTGCPTAFIDLAIRCTSILPSDRPQIKQVLLELKAIEVQVLLDDEKRLVDPAEKAYHIGSMNFGGHMRTRKQLSRPVGPGRMPSFEGKISVPRGSTSGSELSDDEAVEDVLKALENVNVEGGTDARQTYSTLVIGRGSKITASVQDSSTPTLKPVNHVQEVSAQSFPSIPSSWLAGVPSDIRAAIRGDDTAVKARLQGMSENGSVSSTVRAAEGQDTITSLVSLAAATVNGGGEEYIQDSPESSPIIDQDVFFPAPSHFDHALHRFTLVRPGWRFFTSSKSNAAAANELKRVQTLSKTSLSLLDSAEASNPAWVQSGHRAKSSGDFSSGFSKCEFCDRRLGLLKTYMACDDCGYRCHTKCADIAPRTCQAAFVTEPVKQSGKLKRSRVQSMPNFN